ncbi:hypothetical protein SteCoe_15929 [Stentor coeruleus]|uniref:Uncharacterized protein n=1 Tax=Stentor coeruleus TaxID=5963 RepID=A0A1R2C2F3_9CILI|nr:hypothetical protein SteCoe_15929 [Stentor coeruleus]
MNHKAEEDSICVTVKDINSRFRSKEDFYIFFKLINQRLLPSIKFTTNEYFYQVLSGDKKLVPILDSRNYYFPRNYLKHSLLAPENLQIVINNYPLINQYVPNDCKEQEYLIKILSTFNINKLKEIDEEIRNEEKLIGLPQY